MHRPHRIVLICLALAASLAVAAGAQDAPRTLRGLQQTVRQRTAPAQPESTASDARNDTAAMLAAVGATKPFDLSKSGRYLVAAERNGRGILLCDAPARRRLRLLEDSNRPYSLVKISADARWIAGVRSEQVDVVDLWRADNGRRVARSMPPAARSVRWNSPTRATSYGCWPRTARASSTAFRAALPLEASRSTAVVPRPRRPRIARRRNWCRGRRHREKVPLPPPLCNRSSRPLPRRRSGRRNPQRQRL